MVYCFDLELDVYDGFSHELDWEINGVFACLRESGQILQEELQIVSDGKTIRIPVSCPEKESLNKENMTVWGRKIWEKIESLLMNPIRIVFKGTDPQYQDWIIPENVRSYMLKPLGVSPVICCDTFEPIPPYKLPFTDESGESYNKLNRWHRNYQRCYGLWLIGTVGEQFAQRQMQDFQSPLNQEGYKIARRIEELTGKTTDYFLFNYRGWSWKLDYARKCPSCDGNWIIEGRNEEDFPAFHCKKCRLVSELSKNVYPEKPD